MFSERLVSANGVQLNLAVGPASGPPLLLLHGVLRGWRDFAPLWPALLPRWHVHASDHRGHGDSQRCPGHYHVRDYVADAAALVAAEFPDGVVLVGHSLGALVALAVAAEMPQRVRAVVLEDPPAPTFLTAVQDTAYHGVWSGLHELARSGPRSVAAMAAALADLAVPTADGQSRRLGELRDATSLRFSARCLLDVDPEVLPPLLCGDWLNGVDMHAFWGGVRCPALVLRGEEERGGMLGRSEAEALVGLMADGALIDVPGVGHLVHWMAAETTTRLMLGFLESL